MTVVKSNNLLFEFDQEFEDADAQHWAKFVEAVMHTHDTENSTSDSPLQIIVYPKQDALDLFCKLGWKNIISYGVLAPIKNESIIDDDVLNTLCRYRIPIKVSLLKGASDFYLRTYYVYGCSNSA